MIRYIDYPQRGDSWLFWPFRFIANLALRVRFGWRRPVDDFAMLTRHREAAETVRRIIAEPQEFDFAALQKLRKRSGY